MKRSASSWPSLKWQVVGISLIWQVVGISFIWKVVGNSFIWQVFGIFLNPLGTPTEGNLWVQPGSQGSLGSGGEGGEGEGNEGGGGWCGGGEGGGGEGGGGGCGCGEGGGGGGGGGHLSSSGARSPFSRALGWQRSRIRQGLVACRGGQPELEHTVCTVLSPALRGRPEPR